MTWDKDDGQGPSTVEGQPTSSSLDSSLLCSRAEPPASSAHLDPNCLGRYRLIASLGQGGMANVYLAVALGPAGFNKLMVVKALRDDVGAHSEEFAAMFLDEARLSARLNHPNIVQTYEIGEADGRFFIAMEYLEGQPLRVVQRRLGRVGLPLEEELRILAETARGLHYAHELRGLHGEFLGVVHRDVSPQNIFLTYDGQIKLLDFGIAKARDAEHLTKVGVIKGKLDYIAPEQIRGEKVDRRADVFSLGAMLWEAVTGQRFAGGSRISDVTKMHQRLVGAERPASDLNPEVPDALRLIVERARALDPAERFPTAAAFADELEGFLKTLGMHPSAKTLSDRLGPPFAAERAKIGWLIEQQVRQAVESDQGRTTLPNIGRRELLQSGAGLGTGSFVGTGTGGSLGGAEERGSRPSGGLFAAPIAPSLSPPRSRYAGLSAPKIIAVATVLALASGAALLVRKDSEDSASLPAHTREREAAPTNAATSSRAGAAAGSVTDQPALRGPAPVHLQIHVVPAEAQATLDGSILPKLPFAAELTRDGMLHHVEAFAPGHRSKRVLVPFDRDRDVTIVLDPLPAESPRSARAKRRGMGSAESSVGFGLEAQSAAGAQTTEEILPGAKLSTKRRVHAEIDTADPYAN